LRILLVTAVLLLIATALIYWQIIRQPVNTGSFASPSPRAPTPLVSAFVSAPAATPSPTSLSAQLTPPISNALARITKKPFGLYVTPTNSPISPEKFTGYHTGVDFETLPDEADVDVPIYAVCSGPLRLKERASGYGGVAVQQCILANQTATIIYGHLRLASISAKAGEQLVAGQPIAVLGTGYSIETDGERKHLHLGIHQGTQINILGYVQNQTDLASWLDALQYLK